MKNSILSSGIAALVAGFKFTAGKIFQTIIPGKVTLTGPISSGTGTAAKGISTDLIPVVRKNQTGTPNSYGGETVVGSKGTLILGASNQIPDGPGKGDVTIDGKLQLGGFPKKHSPEIIISIPL